MLFGKNPQTYFPRARVRFVRYDGIEEKVGTEMNVIKDVTFEGKILEQIRKSISFLDTQIKEKTFLGRDGLFVTEEEYPKFVREEIIVNAVTHRDYSIKGTDIQIKMFDDRIVVESPGKLPGLVKAENIRHTHFSRNPKIAEFLRVYKYVKEYGEGVDRMFIEMEKAGLPEPEYRRKNFMLETVIRNSQEENRELDTENRELNKISSERLWELLDKSNFNQKTKLNIIKVYDNISGKEIFSAKNVVSVLGCSSSAASEIIRKLKQINAVEEIKGKGKGKVVFIE